jgi:hypothetical protein
MRILKCRKTRGTVSWGIVNIIFSKDEIEGRSSPLNDMLWSFQNGRHEYKCHHIGESVVVSVRLSWSLKLEFHKGGRSARLHSNIGSATIGFGWLERSEYLKTWWVTSTYD